MQTCLSAIAMAMTDKHQGTHKALPLLPKRLRAIRPQAATRPFRVIFLEKPAEFHFILNRF